MVKRNKIEAHGQVADFFDHVTRFASVKDLAAVRVVSRGCHAYCERRLGPDEWLLPACCSPEKARLRTALTRAAALESRCAVCLAPFDGAFHDVFGVYAHEHCLRKCLVAVEAQLNWPEACSLAERHGVALPPHVVLMTAQRWQSRFCFCASRTVAFGRRPAWFVADEDTLPVWLNALFRAAAASSRAPLQPPPVAYVCTVAD